jgi:FHA domain
MDALDLVIFALRLALVLVLYLFLLAVLRAAWRGLAGPTAEPRSTAEPRAVAEPRAAAAPRAALGLRVEEPAASGLAPGQLLEVPDGATLGRGASAEVRVADPTVSARHARLVRAGRRWLVDDLGSTNGTTVNEARVRDPTALEPGDLVALGSVKLRVVGTSS